MAKGDGARNVQVIAGLGAPIPDDPTYAFERLDRANHFIAELVSAMEKLGAIDPTSSKRWQQINAPAGSRTPREIWLPVGDAIHSMRSALDGITCTMIQKCGGNGQRVQFPIIDDRDQVKENPERILRDKLASDPFNVLPENCRAAIEAARPYQGGNELLWGLHRLDIADKHLGSPLVNLTPHMWQRMGPGGSGETRPAFKFTMISLPFHFRGDVVTILREIEEDVRKLMDEMSACVFRK